MGKIKTWLDDNFRVLALLVVLIVSLVGVQFLLLPQYATLQESGVLQYDQVASTLADRELYLQKLTTMEANYTKLDQRLLQTVDTILPANFSNADLFNEFSQLFAQTNLSIQSINIANASGQAVTANAATSAATDGIATPTTLNTAYDIIQVTVNVSAASAPSYTDFKKILGKFEDYPHLMNMNSLSYAPDTDAFTLIFTTYRRKTATL